MSSSTSKFDQLSTSQAGKEVRINQLLDSMSPASLGGRRESTTTGLAWGYYGGQIVVNGNPTDIANGTVALTASSTNYVQITQAGTIVVGTTRDPRYAPLYTVVTTVSGVTSYTDERDAVSLDRLAHGNTSIAVTTANVTLTQAQALCDTLTVTGALTAARDLIVPLVRRRWVVRHTGTSFDVRVIGATGTGITIGIAKTAIVECDGTNVLRVTADV
jgi:hypothetical protein